MKTVLLLTVLFGLNAGAETLTCRPPQPCDHVYDLDKCVSSVVITANNTEGLVQINYRHENPSFEVLFVPDIHRVSVSRTARTISFQDETGDQYGELALVTDSDITGFIVIDQDFAFDLTCSK